MKNFLNMLLCAVVLSAITACFYGCKGGSSPSAANAGALGDEPSVTFKDLQGNNVTMAGLKGKVVLVNFWATWCEPCHDETPMLIHMQQEYGAKGFTLLGIAMDEEGTKIVAPYVQSTQFSVDGHPAGINYPIVLGSDDIATQFGGLLGMPTSYLISRDGKIIKKYIGSLTDTQVAKDVQGQL
jgi:thiol-disulfide isomerase/thioredoxin